MPQSVADPPFSAVSKRPQGCAPRWWRNQCGDAPPAASTVISCSRGWNRRERPEPRRPQTGPPSPSGPPRGQPPGSVDPGGVASARNSSRWSSAATRPGRVAAAGDGGFRRRVPEGFGVLCQGVQLPFGLPSGDHPRRQGPRPGPGRGEVGGGREVESLTRFSSARSAARRTRVCASRANWLGFGQPLESGFTAAAIECRVISFLPQPHHADVQTAAVVPAGGTDDAQPSSVVVDPGARPSALQERGLRKLAPLRSARSRVAYQMCASLSVAQMCPGSPVRSRNSSSRCATRKQRSSRHIRAPTPSGHGTGQERRWPRPICKRQRTRLQRERKRLDKTQLQYETDLQALLTEIAALPSGPPRTALRAGTPQPAGRRLLARRGRPPPCHSRSDNPGLRRSQTGPHPARQGPSGPRRAASAHDRDPHATSSNTWNGGRMQPPMPPVCSATSRPSSCRTRPGRNRPGRCRRLRPGPRPVGATADRRAGPGRGAGRCRDP